MTVNVSNENMWTVEQDLLRQLNAGDTASLNIADIISMAQGGHPPADRALRAYVHAAIDENRFDQLPPQIRTYFQHAARRAPL